MTSKMVPFFIPVLLAGVAFLCLVDGQGTCQDRISNCNAYSDSVCQSYKAWAKQDCSKRCGLCQPDACTPKDCGDNSVMDMTTCKCVEKPCDTPCPQNSFRLTDCRCECTNGRPTKTYNCVCPKKQCASNFKVDDLTCECVRKACTNTCPKNSRRLSDCTCECETGRVIRNNACVCPQKACGWNQVVDERTCQCVKKPCTNTCPANAVRLDDCKCQIKSSCPSGWKHYYGDQTCLMVVGFRKLANRITWDNAKGQCQYFGGSLVIIRDEYKNAFVKAMVPKDGVVWIGLKNVARDAKDFTFKYVDGSYPGDYHPWTINNPDNYNGQERCVVLQRTLWDGYWNDLDCGATSAYVCQKQAKQ